MTDYNAFKCENLSDSYRKHFFSSIFGKISKELVPFIWTEGKEEFELYILDTNTFLQKEMLAFFLKFQQKNPKPIACFSPMPLVINDDLFRNTSANFVWLSYLKNGPLIFDTTEPKNDLIELKKTYDKELDSLMLKYFINDKRLWCRDKRMRSVFQNISKIHESFGNRLDYNFFLHNGKLAAYLSGLNYARYIGMATYAVECIWILDGLEKNIKSEIVYKLIQCLNSRGGPYLAGIHYDNIYSRNFFTRNGFAPYFVRFLKWPSGNL